MKPLSDRGLAVASIIKQAVLTAPLLLSGVAAFAAEPADSNLADPTPTLALYHSTANNSEITCPLDLPEAGSGTTVNLLPKDSCPKVPDGDDDDKEVPFKSHTIRIRNVPIKSTFLLTDNARCEKANSAWIELDTSRANASLEKLGIDKLWTYAGSPEKPGYVTNTGLDSNAPSFGFRVIGKGSSIKQGELACIVVTLARRSY